MMEVYAEVLSDRSLRHVAAIDFSWFPNECQAPRFSRDAPEMGLRSRHATWRPRWQGVGGLAHGASFGKSSVSIIFSRRNPADPLPARADGQQLLLVAMYAWDGNAYPGNGVPHAHLVVAARSCAPGAVVAPRPTCCCCAAEFWLGSLSASGDPAAACCSTIALLQAASLHRVF